MRLTLIALVVLMIAEFMLSLRRTGLPTVVVVVDDSASMGIVDRYDDKKLQTLIAERLKSAGLEEATGSTWPRACCSATSRPAGRASRSNYKLKVYFVGARRPRRSEAALDELRTGDPRARSRRRNQSLGRGPAQRAGRPARHAAGGHHAAYRRHHTDGETLAEAARYARRKGVPLFTVGLGSEKPVRDLELADLLVDEVVFVDDIVNFEFKLTGTGLAGRTVDVVLREKEQARPCWLGTKVTVGADGKPQRLRLPYRPTKVGEFEYVVEVEPLKDEAQADNNRQQRLVSVRKEQIRVLLVQAYPNYEFRYLKNMLERDSTIKLKTVLQDADLEYAELDQSALRVFPVRREELFEYDVHDLRRREPCVPERQRACRTSATSSRRKGAASPSSPARMYTPLAYPQHAAGAAVSDRSRRRPACPSHGATISRRLSSAADRAGPGQPANAAGRHAGRHDQHLAELARPVLAARSADAEAGRPRAGRASHAAGQPTAASCRCSACSTSAPARCCSTAPTKPGAGAIASAMCSLPAIGCKRFATSAARSCWARIARPSWPPTGASIAAASPCGCGCASSTSGWRRPKTTA